MADFTEIIQEIDDEIKTNGKKGIDGKKLNGVLKDMIADVDSNKTDSLSIGSVFGGFVSPFDEIPFGDDHRYFYFATQSGNYSNFGIDLSNDYSLIMFSYDEYSHGWVSSYIAPSMNGLSANYVERILLYKELGFEVFNRNKPYNEGDIVVHEGRLYYFITNHNGEWDSQDVERTSLSYLIHFLLENNQ